METSIFYFTGTGNSLKIAKDIGNNLNNSTVISIAKNISNVNRLNPKGTVGFVFPVFYCGIPQIVDKFLKEINLADVSYTFIAAVYGATAGNGGCIHQVKNIFKEKQIELNSAFYVKSVDNFIVWTWDVPPTEKHDKLHKDACKRADFISKIVLNKTSYYDKSLVEYIGPVLFRHKNFLKTVNNKDKKFSAGNNCNRCGLCVKVCPVKNIEIDKTVKWLHQNCQFCLGCLHLCPNKSINYGKVTLKRQRYRNPYIKMEEYFS